MTADTIGVTILAALLLSLALFDAACPRPVRRRRR